MTKWFRLSLAAGALGLAALAAAPLLAQQDPGQGPPPGRHGRGLLGGGRGPMGPMGPGGPGRRGPGPMGMLGGLGPALHQAQVTDEQQQQIKGVLDSHRDEFKAIGERLKAAHDGMRAAVEADTIDENAIRAKSAEIAAIQADEAVLGARVRAEVMAVLTPEQVQAVKAFRAEMEQRMKQRPPRRPPLQQ